MAKGKLVRRSYTRATVAIGRLVLPNGINREDYIADVYRTHRADVLTNRGDYIRNCPIVYSFCGVNDGLLHSLDIPKTRDDLGSQVVMLKVDDSKIPLIIGCLPYATGIAAVDEDEQLKMFRTSETGRFLIEGRGLKGVINLIAGSEDEDGAIINISTDNVNETGEIRMATDYYKIYATNSFELEARSLVNFLVRNLEISEDEAVMKYLLGEGYTYLDEFGNTMTFRDGVFVIDSPEINLGESAEEPVVLGDTLKGLLENTLDAIGRITVPTAFGPSGVPINIAEFQAIKAQLETMLSQKSKVE